MRFDDAYEQAFRCPPPPDELASYPAALRTRGLLLIWLGKDMAWITPQNDRPGRPAVSCDGRSG